MRWIAFLLIALFGGGGLVVLLGEPASVEPEAPSADRPVPDRPTCRLPVTEPAPDRRIGTPDVGAFDIAGLRLEMTLEDVQAVVECGPATERSVTLRECAADLIEQERLWREARKREVVNTQAVQRNCVSSLVWRWRERRFTVNFVEDLPNRPGAMIVYQISTVQEGSINEASIRAFRQALFAKYGPSTTDSKTDLIWGKYPGPQLRFFPYSQYYLDLVHRGGKAARDRIMLKFVSDAAPTVEPRL